MTRLTPRIALLRVGSAKALTRSAADGTIKESGDNQHFYL
jgi:hypothetical protein